MKHKIKGDITSWNFSIYDFNSKMRAVKEDEDIELEINSYGGDVFAGIDIMNSLRSHKGKVTITVTGIAASAASIICMGADVVKMYSNTQLMLHNAWTYAAGNAKQLRKIADDLDSIGESVLASYTHRLDESTVKELLENETYLSANKAIKLGLADEIVDAKAEEVESELFQDKVKEFNNLLTAKQTENLEVDSLKAEIAELKKQINNQTKEPIPAAAENTRFFF